MKILTYEVEGRIRLGIWNKEETWIYPVESFGMEYRQMQEVIRGISESEIQLLNHMAAKDPYEIRGAVPTENARILAPILKPGQDVWLMQRSRPGIRRKLLGENAPMPSIFPNG